MALFFITCFLVKSAKIKKMKNYYLQTYYDLVPLFMSEGFRLYLVGGAVRDYLLGLKPQDFDLATNATPEEMANFLPNVRVTFARFGNVQFEFANKIFDVTTLRKERNYQDARHPSKVIFVDNIEEDYVRRDFTVNALYLDEKGIIHDFCQGINDLKARVIRMIGDPSVRLREDPLRILRALRLVITYDFTPEETLKAAMINNAPLVSQLTPAKVNFEIKRMQLIDEGKTNQLLAEYGLKNHY